MTSSNLEWELLRWETVPTLRAHSAILSSLRGKGDYWLEGLYLTIWRTGSCFPRVKLVRVRGLSIVPNMKSQISSKCTWCEWGWWSLFHISFSLKLRPVSCCFPLNPNGTFFSGNGRNSSTLFPGKKSLTWVVSSTGDWVLVLGLWSSEVTLTLSLWIFLEEITSHENRWIHWKQL